MPPLTQQPATTPLQSDDWPLLHAYTRENSHDAFRTLVERHTPWLFAAALRQLRDRHRAEDAIQIVFILLAQRAHTMNPRQQLTGWLFNTLRFTVKNFHRAARNRARHELSALRQPAPAETSTRELAEVLDDAVARLPEPYRLAILLRFHQDQPFDEVARRLSITEAAARKRVDRALLVLRRHIGTTASASLFSASAAIGLEQPTIALTQTIAHAALAAKAGTVPVALASSLKGVTTLMAITKLQTAALAVALVLALGVPATYVAVHVATAPQTVAATATEPVTLLSATTQTATPQPYSLAPGEVVARVPAPFSDEARRPALAAYEPWVKNSDRVPDAMILKWRENQPLQPFEEGGAVWSDGHGYNLGLLLRTCFALHRFDVEGPRDLLSTRVSGDFILRADASESALLRAMEKIIQDGTGRTVSLEFREVPREFYTLLGTWNHHPIPGAAALDAKEPPENLRYPQIHLYESANESVLPANNYPDTLDRALSNILNAPVQLTATNVPSYIRLYDHYQRSPDAAVDSANLLQHISEQTGLSWTKSTRPTRRLFISPTQ